MPSFDVVSEVNHHELSNAVDQANREVTTRFDFKGTGSNFDLAGNLVNMNTQSEFQLQQMYDILCNKLVKRGVDIACLELADPVIQLKTATQVVTVREGIDTAEAKKMVKLIKDRKMKVQAAIQGDQLRVTRPVTRDRQEARRFAGSDRATQGGQIRDAAAVQEFPRLTGKSRPPAGIRHPALAGRCCPDSGYR
jgi:uncharacterized protein YajQ (UPF0234 family)